MVVRRAQCPAGPASQPKMSSTFTPEGECSPATSSDAALAWPTPVPRSSAAWDEMVFGQSDSIDLQISSTSGIPANNITQEDDPPLNFSDWLESDQILSPGAHDNIHQNVNQSSPPAQPQHGSSLMSTAVESFPEPDMPRDEQAGLGSQNLDGDLRSEYYPEDCLEASLGNKGTLPQAFQNPLKASLSQPSTELLSFPNNICSVCFQPLHLYSFFACHQRTSVPPDVTFWNEPGGVPWSSPTIPGQINMIGSDMCDEGITSNRAMATPSRHPSINMVAGSDVTAGTPGPVEGLEQESE